MFSNRNFMIVMSLNKLLPNFVDKSVWR